MVARESVKVVVHAGVPGGMQRVAEFSRFLIREDRSPATVRSYGWALKDFAEYLRAIRIRHLEEVARADIESWQDRLVAVGMKPRSRSLATTAVRQFLKWAADHDYCDPRLAGWLVTVRLRPLQPKPIASHDLAILRAHYAPLPVGTGIYRLQRLRNRALFFTLLSTGARVSEALRMPRAGFARVTVQQKGGTDKLLTIPESIQPFITDYLKARADPAPLLFISHPGEHPLDPGSVRQVWQRTAREIGIPPFTTHQLRHTYATELLEKGVDSRIVAAMMGHRSMQSIMGYTKLLEGSRQLAMKAIEDVIQAPTLTSDPRLLPKTRRRGRPKFRLVRE